MGIKLYQTNGASGIIDKCQIVPPSHIYGMAAELGNPVVELDSTLAEDTTWDNEHSFKFIVDNETLTRIICGHAKSQQDDQIC